MDDVSKPFDYHYCHRLQTGAVITYFQKPVSKVMTEYINTA
jgi:hypothetical protein